MCGGKNPLGLLTLSSQTSHGTSVTLDIDTSLFLEGSDTKVDEDVVEVLTTQVSVTISGLDLEDSFLDGEEGHIEGTTTEIEDDDVLLVLLVKTVGNSGGGRLVDDTEDLESSDDTSVLGGLSLGVIEVGWDGDDGVLDILTEVRLSDFLHLGEDHGRDFLRAKLLGASTWHIN